MEFLSSSVTFAGQGGVAQENGIYTSTYTLQPGFNRIAVEGKATTDYRWTEIGCPATCNPRSSPIERSDIRTIEVYGVEIQVDPIPIILLDENGYTTKDYTISYTITPPEYKALTAFMFIYKDGELIAQIPTELSGTGTATLSRGFWFDVNSTYEAEVVLNYGTGVEIRSDKKKLSVGALRVVNDNGEDVDEVRFGDGSKAEKRYHIEIVSKVLTESCDTLTGKISVINKEGIIISIPVPEEMKDSYYLPKYDLEFSLTDGKCVIKIKDEKDGGAIKNKFVISNLTKGDLQNRPFDPNTLAVLYGGIGNNLAIEINNAMTEVPIEAVGIILIGIDGLRQDVLYPVEKDDVIEGNYRLDIKDLPGIKQILGGYDQPEENQKYIMLPRVTAIFPSITYASWASILTGEQPSKTGITGNEFFARDLAGSPTNPIPGMEEAHIPSGMVSLSCGAFQPGKSLSLDLGIFGTISYGAKDTEFVFSHTIPAEFPFLGSTPSPTLSTKLSNSAPLAALQVKPLFEEIEKTVKDKFITPPNTNMRCDQISYECRTVAMYHHYAKGADWWGTPTTLVKELINLIMSGKTGVMDRAPASDAIGFINGYFSNKNPKGRTKRFPALFTIYYSGLDHVAHKKGMEREVYSGFFRDTTDPEIKRFVEFVKEKGEFDNKIFIIVADHGMTAMPTNLTYKKTVVLSVDEFGNKFTEEVVSPAEMSCALNLDFQTDPSNPEEGQNKRKAERANNNLHIWELANLFAQFPHSEIELEVLTPDQISSVLKSATSDINIANIAAALNGPMAHIYIKGTDWQGNPDPRILGIVLDRLNKVLKVGSDATGSFGEKVNEHFPKISSSIDFILIRRILDGEYEVLDSIGEDVSGNKVINTTSVDSYFSGRPGYIDALKRIQGMTNRTRSGDIILVMKDSIDDIGERFTTGTACKSWHGSLNASDSYVPFIWAYPGGNKYEMDQILRGDSVCKADYGNCRGNWNVTNIIREFSDKQYRAQ